VIILILSVAHSSKNATDVQNAQLADTDADFHAQTDFVAKSHILQLLFDLSAPTKHGQCVGLSIVWQRTSSAHCPARRVSVTRSSSDGGQTTSSASPANLNTSPPCELITLTSSSKYEFKCWAQQQHEVPQEAEALCTFASVSSPSCLSAIASHIDVKPLTSANSTADYNTRYAWTTCETS